MLPSGLRGVPQGRSCPAPNRHCGRGWAGSARSRRNTRLPPFTYRGARGRIATGMAATPTLCHRDLPRRPCWTLPHGRASPRSGGRREGGTCEACKPDAAIAPPLLPARLHRPLCARQTATTQLPRARPRALGTPAPARGHVRTHACLPRQSRPPAPAGQGKHHQPRIRTTGGHDLL